MAQTTFSGHVTDEDNQPIQNAEVEYFIGGQPSGQRTWSNEDGGFELRVEHEDQGRPPELQCSAFGLSPALLERHRNDVEGSQHIHFRLAVGLQLTLYLYAEPGRLVQTQRAVAGRRLAIRAESNVDPRILNYEWRLPEEMEATRFGREAEGVPRRPGTFEARVRIIDRVANAAGGHAGLSHARDVEVAPGEVQKIEGDVRSEVHGDLNVRLHRAAMEPTLDQALWVAIKNRTHAISFGEYRKFMDRILFGGGAAEGDPPRPPALDFPRGVEAYRALKYLTEVFLLSRSGVFIAGGERWEPSELGEQEWRRDMERKLHEYLGHPQWLPYFKTIIQDAFPWVERDAAHDPVLLEHIDRPPLIELIHEYWLEEGMLMQTINAVSRRFQNVRSMGDRDPLANFELDPLRRINNWLWGFIQDEVNRLTVKRRAFEYLHEYGLPLFGKATGAVAPADNRSKFVEAFHNLLHQASIFFKQDDQTTIIADAYPLLNSLKEVHLILAAGDSNQAGDMPWAARVETLLVQYILAQPAMREFLQARAMVPYQEAWMPQVDAMKNLQGWSDVTVTHFRNLAVYGEQILLSIRYGNWIDVFDAHSAGHWARDWRGPIQIYLSSYRAVTGVDLTAERVDAAPPAVHLQHRLTAQQRAR
jgi:hypothetical protein